MATDDLGAVSLRSGVLTVTFPYDGDGNGLPDDYEITIFGHTGNPRNGDADGDGLTNLYEYQHGSDPTNYYSQGSFTIVPLVEVDSGDGQVGGKGLVAEAPFVVKITNSIGGAPLNGAPVTFSITSGGGLLYNANFNSGTSLTIQTGTNGKAQILYRLPAADNTGGTISAGSGGQSVTFSASSTPGDGTFDPPSAPTVQIVDMTETVLTWENHATAADYIKVQQNIDGGAWTTIATFTDITTKTYTVTGLSPGIIYDYRIVAGKN